MFIYIYNLSWNPRVSGNPSWERLVPIRQTTLQVMATPRNHYNTYIQYIHTYRENIKQPEANYLAAQMSGVAPVCLLRWQTFRPMKWMTNQQPINFTNKTYPHYRKHWKFSLLLCRDPRCWWVDWIMLVPSIIIQWWCQLASWPCIPATKIKLLTTEYTVFIELYILRGFVLVRKRTILTKRPPLVGEVSANTTFWEAPWMSNTPAQWTLSICYLELLTFSSQDVPYFGCYKNWSLDGT
jgi:hypothetical protein